MISCIRSNFVRKQIRQYSTESKDSLFLSDLLNRIDKINAKSKSIITNNKLKKPTTRVNNITSRKDTKVQVADHPLASSSFKDNARKFNNNNNGQKFRESRPPRDSRPRQSRETRDLREPKSTNTADSASKSRQPRRDVRPKSNFSKRTSNKTPEAQQFKSKNLVIEAYKPEVNGNTFFYGKATTVNACLTSRVASVTKEALLESKYPYNLPKSIIESLDDTPKNKFLLQKNFTLDVNEEKFSNRINEVVKGKWEELKFDQKDFKDSNALKAAEFLKNGLMKNGDLSLANKKAFFEVGAGLKTFKKSA